MLTTLLYLGPLAGVAVEILNHPSRYVQGKMDALRHGPRSAYLRNLVVGPVSEELVFRACIVPLLLEAGFSLRFAILVSPLFFGIAHVHHVHRRIVQDRVPVDQALVATALQLTYTTLFGAFAAFCFVRTSHLIAAIAPHIYCNHMGLPDVDFLVDHTDLRYSRRRFILLAHLLGILLFILGLFPLTHPRLYPGSYFWDQYPSSVS